MKDSGLRTGELERMIAGMVVAVPAYNEEESLRELIPDIRHALPGAHLVIINDGSSDFTLRVAKAHGADVLDIPHNMGVGGAMQLAFQYAVRRGCRSVLRIDSDGQHPPREAVRLIEKYLETKADLVVGSRFGATSKCVSTGFRYVGIRCLSFFLSRICRVKMSDPTSGFWFVNGSLVDYFAHDFPTEYPEPEALALMRRLGYSYAEVPVRFRPRIAGVSSIGPFDAFYFIIKVGIALVVDRVRKLNRHYAKRGTGAAVAARGRKQ